MTKRKKNRPVTVEETREAVELLIEKEAQARLDEADAFIAETDALLAKADITLAEADTVLARLRRNRSWTH